MATVAKVICTNYLHSLILVVHCGDNDIMHKHDLTNVYINSTLASIGDWHHLLYSVSTNIDC